MKAADVLVSGSLAFDRIMNFPGRFRDHILPEKIHLLNVSFTVDDLREQYGGTAGNIAYTLRLLGVPVAVLATAGADFGPYQQWLLKHGVDLRPTQLTTRVPTAVASMVTDRDDNQITAFYPGALALAVPAAIVRAALARRPKLVVLAPSDVPTTMAVGEAAQHANVPYLFDPGQQTTVFSSTALARLLRRARLFVSNDYERALVLKKIGWSLKRLERTVETVITTLGPQGSIVSSAGKRIHVRAARPQSELDPTGAGDAFRAGFLAAYLHGHALETAARLGSVAAAYTVERFGTQTHRFSRAAIAKRYQENYRQRLTL
ncbi:MAG: carbohydrate kinase family protein [Candidatus Kerfeldbacteria bacterium]|nr:carbohydrate kinase family protein [Candidatus Kerfeldbacteria bacterium]